MPLRRGELARHGHWNIALAYYRREDVLALRDPNGDALIRGFLLPLVQQLQSAGLLRDYNWIRYSENGFHLRCRFRVEDAGGGEAQRALIRSAFERCRQEQPALFRGEAELSPIALVLNRKQPDYQLRAPGTLELGPVQDTLEDCVYDSFEAFRLVTQIQTQLAALCLDAVVQGHEYSRCMALAQVAGYDLLRCLSRDLASFCDSAAFVCATWRDFFGISGNRGEDQVAHVWNRQQAFYHLFDRKLGAAGSLVAVPPPLRAAYTQFFDWLQLQDLTPLHAQAQELRAMQVLSLFHQQFNRLGISIVDETAYADLLHEYALRDLDAAQRAAVAPTVAQLVEYWSHNRVEA